MSTIYSMTDRISPRYEWKLLSSLVEELKPVGLPEAFACKLLTIVAKRSMSDLKQLADEWSPQIIRDQLGYTLHACALVYQLTSLIRKFARPVAEEEEQRELNARCTFDSAELACEQANGDLPRRLAFPESSAMTDCLTYARRFIDRVLGQEVDMDDVYKGARPGTGQSFKGVRGGKVTSFYKYSEPDHWTVTNEALPYVINYISTDDRRMQAYEYYYRTTYKCPASRSQRKKGKKFVLVQRAVPLSGPLQPGWLSSLFVVVRGNRISTVPKDAFTKRTIAIEPGLNLELQLGVEDIIRRRLKRWGVDLDDQSKNQKLAKLASETGSHSTIDLKAASDSISLEIVRFLLPSEWFLILDALRSQEGTYDDDDITYEKISSMGNGFTFALESLIFAALTYGCYKYCGIPWDHTDVAVYGDDVVCRSETSLLLTELFTYCGFSVNLEKSFYHGSFRESCGADFINGVDVRPVFHKEPVEYVDDLFVLHNQLYKWISVHIGNQDISPTLALLKKWVPAELQFSGPLVETTNTHLFSEINPDRSGHFVYKGVQRSAIEFKHANYVDFHFKRLMNRLPESRFMKESSIFERILDGCGDVRTKGKEIWRSYKDVHLSATGSIYNVSRRDAFLHTTVKMRLPSWQAQTFTLR